MHTDMDNFFVELPNNATYRERVMLVATAIMMDFAFFEENEKKEK